jgi:hypothetical protein
VVLQRGGRPSDAVLRALKNTAQTLDYQ